MRPPHSAHAGISQPLPPPQQQAGAAPPAAAAAPRAHLRRRGPAPARVTNERREINDPAVLKGTDLDPNDAGWVTVDPENPLPNPQVGAAPSKAELAGLAAVLVLGEDSLRLGCRLHANSRSMTICPRPAAMLPPAGLARAPLPVRPPSPWPRPRPGAPTASSVPHAPPTACNHRPAALSPAALPPPARSWATWSAPSGCPTRRPCSWMMSTLRRSPTGSQSQRVSGAGCRRCALPHPHTCCG